MIPVDDNESRILNLMKLDGEAFVNNAYALLLGRHPDSEGLIYYLWRIRCGVSKRKIMVQLLKSPESISFLNKNLEFKTSIERWKRGRFSIKYIMDNSLYIFKKKVAIKNRDRKSTLLNDHLNFIVNNQARMNDELGAMRALLSSMTDVKADRPHEVNQMSRQALHVYAQLIQQMKNSEIK